MIAETQKPVILAVDDDPVNLAVVRDCLVECNYTILVAEDGESAVARAAYAQPDLILLDIMMPGIDGYETCRRLKAQAATREIPVIFMTALAETGHKVKGLEVGAVDYITKPFQREELLARIVVHLQNRELTKRLQEAKELLEFRVAARTAELAQTIDALHEEIMERQRAEEDRVRLARAIEQAAEAVFMADAQWHITYVNPAFERMSGYTRDEVLGQHTRILRSNMHDRDFYLQVRDTLNREGVWSGRITTRKRDGSFFDAETTVSSVLDAKGAIINYVSILRDVTHELRLERELRQSQKMEAIGTLAGGIAHDFNNILTAIMGYTDLAQSRVTHDDALAHDLERVQKASLRAKELVRRILSFSRKTEQEQKPVCLAAIVDEALTLLRATLPATIEIQQLTTTVPLGDMVLADPTQLHQVLMNLGTNAAHAMRAHGGVLSVTIADLDADTPLQALHPDLRPGNCLRLTVSDTGHGMETSVRERIFDPYFTTKHVGEGTGMGLAVVQGIITNHGGAISVLSEPGLGTTFHIFLPKYAGQATSPQAVETLPQRGSERILFVDDEKVLAELGKEMLEGLGYSVTVALNSTDALERFRPNPEAFDLVITDMTMPGLTGKDLAKALMAISPAIPVVLCTGFSEQINEKQALEAGCKGYLMKPYTATSLNTIIRRILEHERAPLPGAPERYHGA